MLGKCFFLINEFLKCLFIHIRTGIIGILVKEVIRVMNMSYVFKFIIRHSKDDEAVEQCSALEGIVSELISDSFRAACSTVWCMLVLFQPLMTVCCNVFRVWLPGKDLDSASHYSITIKHEDTRIHTLHVFGAQQILDLCYLRCKTLLGFFFSLFAEVWRGGCSSSKWWNTGSTARAVNHCTYVLIGDNASLSPLGGLGVWAFYRVWIWNQSYACSGCNIIYVFHKCSYVINVGLNSRTSVPERCMVYFTHMEVAYCLWHFKWPESQKHLTCNVII